MLIFVTVPVTGRAVEIPTAHLWSNSFRSNMARMLRMMPPTPCLLPLKYSDLPSMGQDSFEALMLKCARRCRVAEEVLGYGLVVL